MNDDYWNQVPPVDTTAPGEAGTALPQAAPGRRTVLKALGVLGGALALNVLSWLPPARRHAAQAAVGTETLNCGIYNYGAGGGICVGGPYSPDYCGPDGWFKVESRTCYRSGPVASCGGYNAWRWTHNGIPYRCADGIQSWCGGVTRFLICARPNP